MKFLAVGFLLALVLSVTLAMTLNAQNLPNAAFKPGEGPVPCHGQRGGGRPTRPGPPSSANSSEPEAFRPCSRYNHECNNLKQHQSSINLMVIPPTQMYLNPKSSPYA